MNIYIYIYIYICIEFLWFIICQFDVVQFFFLEGVVPAYIWVQDNDGGRTSPTGRPATLATPSMASTPTSKCTQCLIFFCRKWFVYGTSVCYGIMGVGSNSWGPETKRFWVICFVVWWCLIFKQYAFCILVPIISHRIIGVVLYNVVYAFWLQQRIQ